MALCEACSVLQNHVLQSHVQQIILVQRESGTRHVFELQDTKPNMSLSMHCVAPVAEAPSLREGARAAYECGSFLPSSCRETGDTTLVVFVSFTRMVAQQCRQITVALSQLVVDNWASSCTFKHLQVCNKMRLHASSQPQPPKSGDIKTKLESGMIFCRRLYTSNSEPSDCIALCRIRLGSPQASNVTTSSKSSEQSSCF